MRRILLAAALLAPLSAHAQTSSQGHVIWNYSPATSVGATDRFVLQQGGPGSPYVYTTPQQLLGSGFNANFGSLTVTGGVNLGVGTVTGTPTWASGQTFPALTSTGLATLTGGQNFGGTAQGALAGGGASINFGTGAATFGTLTATSGGTLGGNWLGALNLTASGTALAVTNNATVGGTLGVTGAATFGGITNAGNETISGYLTAASATQLTIASVDASHIVLFKNGPAGAIMLKIGGAGADLEPQTNIALQGGTWGSGALTNNLAPVYQNALFAGSTTNAGAAFGMFLQQTDNSSATGFAGGSFGFFEHLILNGSGVVGNREAGQFTLDINATTGNASAQNYVGVGMKCNLMATDGPGPATAQRSVCFGSNPVSHIGAGVSSGGNVGEEVDTWEEAGANILDRIGIQVVDLTGSTYGTQATRDDVAVSMNNQYAPSGSLGFKVGLEFGRAGGYFPVATNGTLIYGQGNSGATWTVAKGIDWSLGTATGNWLQFGSVLTVDSTGNITIATPATGTAASYACFTSGGKLISSATAC